MTSLLDVASVVVTFNSQSHVAQLLDSIPDAMGDLSYSVTVVDNGSTDATLDLLTSRADCQVVRSSNDGYAAGLNRGVRASAAARAVLVLNPDAVLDPGCVPALLRVLDRSGVGVVAPRVREEDGRLSPTLRRGPTMGRVGGLSFTGLKCFTERIEDPVEYVHEHEVDWAVGAILLIDARCFALLAGMDESYFLYSEETDFSLRAKDAGWATVYTPTAGAMHVGGGSGESALTHTMKIVNRVRLYRRRRGASWAAVYYALTVLVEVRRALLGHGRSWTTIAALLRPSRRPAALRAGDSLLPR